MVVMVLLQVEQAVEVEQQQLVKLVNLMLQELAEQEQRLQLQDHQLLMLVAAEDMEVKVEQMVEQAVVELAEIQV
tara:strand:+ start:334 stop:558 length:225 start_codon:yes stop_codon:yes gene_type:complete